MYRVDCMEGKAVSFTIQVLSKQISKREELEPLCQELIAMKETVQAVTFTGNSYGFEACAWLAHLLAECKSLRVPDFSSLFRWPISATCSWAVSSPKCPSPSRPS